MVNITFLSGDPVMNATVAISAFLCLFILALTIIYIMSLFRPQQKLKAPKRMPAISIIIPAHNEEQNISACIMSMIAADYNGVREIIVVDDGSTDKTVAVLKKLQKSTAQDWKR